MLFHDNPLGHSIPSRKASISSLYLFEGLPLSQLLFIGHQSVTLDVHFWSAMRPLDRHFFDLDSVDDVETFILP